MTRMVAFRCAHCGERSRKPTGHVRRSRSIGAPLYCDRRCAGMARRKHKTKAQKVAEKAAYDREYRAKNLERIKAEKRAYFQRTYDPVQAAKYRKSRMHLHVEYCRQPRYRAYKSDYDRKRRAQAFGPFAAAYLLLLDLDREVNSRMSDYDVRVANGTLNKRLKRKREYEQAQSGCL